MKECDTTRGGDKSYKPPPSACRIPPESSSLPESGRRKRRRNKLSGEYCPRLWLNPRAQLKPPPTMTDPGIISASYAEAVKQAWATFYAASIGAQTPAEKQQSELRFSNGINFVNGTKLGPISCSSRCFGIFIARDFMRQRASLCRARRRQRGWQGSAPIRAGSRRST